MSKLRRDQAMTEKELAKELTKALAEALIV
jgi:hypothetical protein